MVVVAIHRFSGDEQESTQKLATALGGTVYDARMRLRVPSGGPTVVGVFAQMEAASACAERLRNAGFAILVMKPEDAESDGERFPVRRFLFGEHHLTAESRDGRLIELLYRDVELLLRGSDIVRATETEAVTEKKFSMGRALVSGGLMLTKTQKSVRESTTENRECFFHLYSPSQPPLVFRENSLNFEGLGPDLKPTRGLNFAFVWAELRRRCSAALIDERLFQRLGQVQTLGASLPPEKHLDTAITLLAMSLRGTSSSPAAGGT